MATTTVTYPDIACLECGTTTYEVTLVETPTIRYEDEQAVEGDETIASPVGAVCENGHRATPP